LRDHEGTEHLGYLAHELRNFLNTAVLAFDVLKTGRVGWTGSTGAVLGRSLVASSYGRIGLCRVQRAVFARCLGMGRSGRDFSSRLELSRCVF
jgi:hypothetical protein